MLSPFATAAGLAYGGGMGRSILTGAVIAGWIALAAAQAADEPRRVIFTARTAEGEVWANVGLTGQRLDQSYVPMVVAVANRGGQAAVVDRDTIRLIGPDGLRYPMPTLRELRRNYRRMSLDSRSVSGAGIPWEVWRRDGKLVDSNFFPELASSRRAIAIDEVTLAPGFAMVDLLYFAKPPGLGPRTPFVLEVSPIGWETPIRLGIILE